MPDSPRRSLVVLGSTGSIGAATLEVAEHLTRTGAAPIDVVGLAAGKNVQPLIEQARRFNVKHVAIAEPIYQRQLQQALPDATVYAGPDAALRLVEAVECTDVAAAMVGAAGLPATIAAIKRGCTISLANKETLVAAGELIQPLLAKHGARLVPVDSEHSAIFQCLGEHEGCEVRRIVLTASGGPFRTTDRAAMESATVEQALNHPTWNMGPKITIDSASMMNKALEVIEAHWLFNLPAEKITVIIHPQSVVHSFVEFADGSVLAQLGPPDMKTPIQYALTCPRRWSGCNKVMEWSQLRRLDFEPPDTDKFRSIRLAYDVVQRGGTAGAILNGANEAAVAAFLARRVRFGQITRLAEAALQSIDVTPADSLEVVLDADRRARAFVEEKLAAGVSA